MAMSGTCIRLKFKLDMLQSKMKLSLTIKRVIVVMEYDKLIRGCNPVGKCSYCRFKSAYPTRGEKGYAKLDFVSYMQICFKTKVQISAQEILLKSVWYATLWTLWLERNNRIFIIKSK